MFKNFKSTAKPSANMKYIFYCKIMSFIFRSKNNRSLVEYMSFIVLIFLVLRS